MTSADIIKALRKRHGRNGDEWAFFEELRVGTGYKSRRKDHNPQQRFDGWAINLYPSKKHLAIAYEVKVSRSDFLSELKNPKKRQQALAHSNEFYFVAPKGLVDKKEIPDGCGLIEVDDNLNSRIVVKAEVRQEAKLTWNFLATIARRAAKQET